MAGGVLKTFGYTFVILGGIAIVLGLAAAGYGVFELDQEAQKTVPSRERGQTAGGIAVAGAAAIGIGLVLLLLFLPLLIWGHHRHHDTATGKNFTERGGVLKAYGATFLTVGILALIVGAIAAGYGAAVADEETQRFLANNNRGELAEGLLVFGVAVAAAGLVLILFAIPFIVGGNVRAGNARRASAAAPATGAAAVSAAAMSPRGMAFAAIASVAIVTLLAMAVFGNGGPLTTLASGARPSEQSVEKEFAGHIQAGSFPAVGAVGSSPVGGPHVVQPLATRGVVQAILSWDTASPTAAQTLIVAVEAETASGEWIEVGRTSGESELTYSTDTTSFPGAVRVIILVPAGQAVDMDYALLVGVYPA